MRKIHLLHKVVGLFAAVLLLGSCAVIAGPPGSGPSPDTGSTFPYDQYVQGQPNIDMRVDGGCYIWRTGNEWHVRFAKKLDRPRNLPLQGPVITGKVRVRQAVAADLREKDVSLPNDVHFRGKNIVFKFERRNDNFGNDIEGFDFMVKPLSPEYCVTFDILVDGNKMPGFVRLGSFMHVPEELPLKICMHSFD